MEERFMIDETRMMIRQACRARKPLDGTDAQAIEHALTQVEAELRKDKRDIDRLQAEVETLRGLLRQGVEFVEEARPGETVWLDHTRGLLEE